MQRNQLYINGQWVDSLSGETFDDLNPYTGEVYAQVAKGNVQDADRAMAAADAARKIWAAAPPLERAQVLHRAAQILDAEQQAFADVLTHEGGGTVGKVMFEISQTVDLLDTAAADSKRILGETFHNDPAKLSMTLRRPKGTVVAITPLELSPDPGHVQGGLRHRYGKYGGPEAGQ